MEKRDTAPEAIRSRYEKANVQAVTMHDSVSFDALRDIPFLLKERETWIKSLEEYGNMTIALETMKEEIIELKITLERRLVDPYYDAIEKNSIIL